MAGFGAGDFAPFQQPPFAGNSQTPLSRQRGRVKPKRGHSFADACDRERGDGFWACHCRDGKLRKLSSYSDHSRKDCLLALALRTAAGCAPQQWSSQQRRSGTAHGGASVRGECTHVIRVGMRPLQATAAASSGAQGTAALPAAVAPPASAGVASGSLWEADEGSPATHIGRTTDAGDFGSDVYDAGYDGDAEHLPAGAYGALGQ